MKTKSLMLLVLLLVGSIALAWAQPVGDTCENPVILNLPVVDYQGDNEGFSDDYTSAMFTGLGSDYYVGGNDWVGKITLTSDSWLNITMANQTGYTNQYLGMFLVNTIPSLESPAQVLAQSHSSNGPYELKELYLPAGDYYLIVDNWASPWEIYFVLNINTDGPPIYALPYIQDFESGTSLGAIDWSGDMLITANHGTNGSNGLYRNLYSYTNSTNAVTPLVGPMVADSQLMFDYRYVAYSSYPNTPLTLSANDKLEIQVTLDGDTFSTIYTIDQNNHVTSADFANVIVPLAGYADQDIKVKFLATWGAGDYFIDIDNVTVRETPLNPIFSYTPTALDFGTLMQDNPSAWQNVTVSNTGAGTINISANDVSIFGTDATMFEFDAENLPAALGAGNSVIIPVRATATDEGALSATLRMVYNATNYDVALTAEGLPAGTYIIGDGIATSRFPLGSYYGYERSAALYTAAELGAGNKRINTLGWFTTLASSDAVPTKIYLKAYGNNTMTADNWANLIAGATPVFDDTITSIPANDWYMITLANTFDLDSGENLLVLVERNFGGGGGNAGSSAPAIRASTMSNMHLTLLADTNPPTGNGSNQTTRPNLKFLATSYIITDPPNPAIAASPLDEATGVDITATLNWVGGGGAPTGYKLYFGNSTPPAYVGDLGDALSYNPTLAYSSNYYWQVIPYNGNGEASNCPIWSFETMADPTVVLPVTFDFTGEATGAMPTGWERSHTNWSIGATANAGGTSPELSLSWSPSVDANVRAITPPLYGDNEDGYMLKFKHNVNHYSAGDPYTLKVEVSIDKINWTTLWSMVPTAIETTEVLVPNDLGAYLETPFYLAWTFDGNTYDINNWYVDDISITPVISGPPATPILTYPTDTATNMSVDGFDLTWQPDLNTGGEPTYYAVFMSQDEETIFDDFFFEVEDPFFNPVADSEGAIVFGYDERWYWTVAAGNLDGESEPAEIQSFQIEADPTIRNFPWYEGFESYADFSLDLRPWTQYDGDGMTTWGIDGTTFPNQYYVGSFIAFNPDSTTPALPSSWAPHGGSKYAVAFDANGNANDDWLITPPIETTGNLKFGFWARSITDQYGLERFNVLVSTTDKNPASFTKISEGEYTEAPVAWTKYEYPLNYPGQTIYVAIQCVSDDAFAFFVDDVEIVVPQDIDLAINGFTGDSLGQVNTPAMYEVTVANVGLNDVSSYDIYLKDSDSGSTVAIMNVTELLAAGDSEVHEISWIPAFEGEYDIYAEVSTAGDGNLANNTSAPIHLTVYAETMQLLYVGDPETTWVTWAAPFNFYYEDSVAETIYLASEMQATSGTIEALVYTNYFDTADVEYFQIWMQNTNVNDLSAGWLPWEGYTLVYDGPVGGPAGLNLIQIPITPFNYTGGNLAIRTSREWTGDWASSKQWLITVDENYPNRSRVVYQDTEYMDHTNPPVGTVTDNIPNVIFFMDTEDMVTTVVAPEISISGFDAEWQAVPYAYSYNVYASDDPYLFGDEPTTILYTNSYVLPTVEDAQFYRITANTYRDLARGSFNRPALDSGKLQEVDQPVFKQPRYQRSK